MLSDNLKFWGDRNVRIKLPRHSVSAGVLVRNDEGKILLIKGLEEDGSHPGASLSVVNQLKRLLFVKLKKKLELILR